MVTKLLSKGRTVSSASWSAPGRPQWMTRLLESEGAGSALPECGGRWSSRSACPCIPPGSVYILNHMVQYKPAQLDVSLAALSDVTRRGILEQLGRADASITDLAEKFDMTLTGMKKHVGVLEQAGFVTTEKVGRVRTCKLGMHR